MNVRISRSVMTQRSREQVIVPQLSPLKSHPRSTAPSRVSGTHTSPSVTKSGWPSCANWSSGFPADGAIAVAGPTLAVLIFDDTRRI